jgi:hypothetical protein
MAKKKTPTSSPSEATVTADMPIPDADQPLTTSEEQALHSTFIAKRDKVSLFHSPITTISLVVSALTEYVAR